MILSNLYFIGLNKKMKSIEENSTDKYSLNCQKEELREKYKNKLVIHYIILLFIIGIIGTFALDFFNLNNFGISFLGSIKNFFIYICSIAPFIIILLPYKYIALWILIVTRPSEIYRINTLNIYRHYFKEKYVLTASKLYEHCQRRMTILTFIISLFIAFLTFLPSIVTYIFQDMNNQLSNINYNDILEQVNRQIFPPFLALFLILILFIVI